ncbi:1,6-anhydro-N-acetylmuramyl-L-alanine amidase AmpD [Candidatus Albibeggiatoa sp. nov. NOAA]|uniref:1,6-anhydro-N-acetylmuramyl-L-alanine amidase AmpD n=1 Tax=Candidatus Albibeggiatoa sp. nov. NOAA TaxID=3162724 RepID=UPI0032F95D6D|nr:1,6-anhydro-N-acetylmuramyl-L-alanine amidase AmpD [Thiotrichaceae bacterium]
MLDKVQTINLDLATGWLENVRHCPSPNYDKRPEACEIDLLVIHSISLPPCEFGTQYIDDLFMNRLDPNAHPYFAGIADLRVSAHALIRRTGEIVQYVSFWDRAWHTGKSCFQGREVCNDFSIGIELEGCDDLGYTDVQYSELVKLTKLLQQACPSIKSDHIVGHCHIAPERKTDPGEWFEWERFFTAIQSY